jgi:hypothetical protein
MERLAQIGGGVDVGAVLDRDRGGGSAPFEDVPQIEPTASGVRERGVTIAEGTSW